MKVLTIAGSPTYVLAVEFALTPVLSALGAEYVPDSVYAVGRQLSWLTDGPLQLGAQYRGASTGQGQTIARQRQLERVP